MWPLKLCFTIEHDLICKLVQCTAGCFFFSTSLLYAQFHKQSEQYKKKRKQKKKKKEEQNNERIENLPMTMKFCFINCYSLTMLCCCRYLYYAFVLFFFVVVVVVVVIIVVPIFLYTHMYQIFFFHASLCLNILILNVG